MIRRWRSDVGIRRIAVMHLNVPVAANDVPVFTWQWISIGESRDHTGFAPRCRGGEGPCRPYRDGPSGGPAPPWRRDRGTQSTGRVAPQAGARRLPRLRGPWRGLRGPLPGGLLRADRGGGEVRRLAQDAICPL